MTLIRRVHIAAARALLAIAERRGEEVDEKTRKLAGLDINNPKFSPPTYDRRWQDDAADILKARIDKVLELHMEPHICAGATVGHPCRTYQILRGHEDA